MVVEGPYPAAFGHDKNEIEEPLIPVAADSHEKGQGRRKHRQEAVLGN